jgi:hypothetical protein
MRKLLKEKTMESFAAVLPITLIVLFISILWVPMPIGTLTMFLTGAILLIIGMGVFTLGVDMSILPMGHGIGEHFWHMKNLAFVFLLCFAMGTAITVAEPDLQIYASKVTFIPNFVVVGSAAVGVGLFVVASFVRVLLHVSLARILIISYSLLFLLSLFVPTEFFLFAFDSGGVTTGPVTVPFILAVGLGIASMRERKDALDDNFGMIALCGIGPVFTVMLLGLFYDPAGAVPYVFKIREVETTRDILNEYMSNLPIFLFDVTVAILPVACAFIIFQALTRKFGKRQVVKTAVGFGFTFLGLVMFLIGVNVGFLPMGNIIGAEIAKMEFKWMLVPIGMAVGFFIAMAEPSVHFLYHQIEEVSEGAIRARSVQIGISISIAVSLGLAMVRVLTGISLYWFLAPGYAAALALTFFTPRMFVGIGFDSGGVACGPMTSMFVMPFAMGASEAFGGNVLSDAFGVVAMAAMTPLITLQVFGLSYGRKKKRTTPAEPAASFESIAPHHDLLYDVIETHENIGLTPEEFEDEDEETLERR